MTIISFSLAAVARLGVPPGKWFCLARTGLGYAQYSCCVCGMHHEKFDFHWKRNRNLQSGSDQGWKDRLDKSIADTLIDLGYYDKDKSPGTVQVMTNRLNELIYSPDNYIVNTEFRKLLTNETIAQVRILSDGPKCLIKAIFPTFPLDQIKTGKSDMNQNELKNFSDVHVGTNASDLLVPQTRFIISSKLEVPVHSGIRIYPRLTKDVMTGILQM